MEKSIKLADLMVSLGAFKSVRNLDNRNQFVIEFAGGEIFQSYRTVCGVRIWGEGLGFSDAHDYSRTTAKHCKLWCGKDTETRRRMLKDGTAFLVTDIDEP